jgi:hypothetical protein
MKRWCVLAFVTGVCSCTTLTPNGSKVAVYVAPATESGTANTMPDGCRLLGDPWTLRITELEIESQKDPYMVQRNRTGEAGGNALLVRRTIEIPRRTLECPGSSRITDCPPQSGAWYRLGFESYQCTADALHALPAPKPPPDKKKG